MGGVARAVAVLRSWVGARGRRVTPGVAAALVAAAVAGAAVAVGATTTAAAVADPAPAAGPDDVCGPRWVTGWQVSPQAGGLGEPLGGRTLRAVVAPSVVGSAVAVRFSNRYGMSPLLLGPVTAGRAADGAAVVPATVRPVTFDGLPVVVVPAGGEATSDPVAVVAEPGEPVTVSAFLPQQPGVLTVHPVALRTSYLSTPGDHAGDPGATAFTTRVGALPLLTRLDVLAPRALNAVVAVGDSITDGVGSPPDADARWSDALAARLAGAGPGRGMAVLNSGISRGRLLADRPTEGGDAPLTRLAFDVGAARSATDVVLHIGTNDIAAGAGRDAIVAGLVRYAERARTAGLRVFLTTITPSETGEHGTPAAVAVREAVNAWVRAEGVRHADGVFDFAAAVADPARPTRLAPPFDAGDGLHLSAAGYRALAAAVEVEQLTGSPCTADPGPVRVTVADR